MRNLIGVLILVLALACPGKASAGNHGGGIKGGMLISDPVGDREDYNVGSVTTFTYGAFYRYLFEGRFSVQTELIYARKGSEGTYYGRDGRINITYIDLNSIVQYRVLDRERFFGDLYAGPLVSFKLDADIETEIFGATRTYGISDRIKQFDAGIVFGVKFGLTRGNKEYCIDISCSSGFILPDESDEEIDLRNRTFSFMLEIFFGNG